MDDEAWQHIPAGGALLDDDDDDEDESFIRENDYIHISAFPPNHHEGLQPLLPGHNHSSSSSSSSPSPPLLEDDDIDDEPRSLMSARLYRGCLCLGIRFWKVSSVVAAAALAFMYLKKKQKKKMQQRWWWWWRPQKKKATAAVVVEDKVSSLILLIKERDQRINQLLLQIAHMSQLLLTRRRVPVVRLDYN